MKKINKLIWIVTISFLVMIALINVYVSRKIQSNESRLYRVSINRIEKGIEDYENSYNTAPDSLEALCAHTGVEYPSISGIKNMRIQDSTVEEQKAFFKMGNSDYVIITTEHYYYSVSYNVNNDVNKQIIIIVNVIAVIMLVACLAVIIYIRQRIIIPFHRLSDVPYELSKGNLTIPLKEEKDKVFGRFIWGMDLLRENLEENKAKELELQKEKKVLLLSLSHDIKTPLSAIKLYSKALSKNLYKSEEKKQEITENISEKVDEIESYIAEIVKASNEDFISFDIENGEFYIKDVIEEIREYYYDKMTLNHIDFVVSDYSNCLVYGDKNRLVEVIQNIIENAIKYGDGKRISLQFERDDETVSVCVINSGCNLSKRELPHIFDSFFRGSNVEKQQGSGLGLYICRSLIHLMEGEIMAEILEAEGKNQADMKVKVTIRLI